MVRFGRLVPAPARGVARGLGAIGGLSLALVVAACGNAASSGNPGSSGAAAGTIAVEAKEYSFTPPTVTIFSGSATFSVKNTGTEEHEFEIFKPDGTVLDEIEGLVPGLTKTLTVSLEPGAYQFMCKLNGHDQLGMKGTLTVQ